MNYAYPCIKTSWQWVPGDALDGLCLVQHHVVPLDAVEVLGVGDDELVRRDHHVERRRLRVVRVLARPELAQHFAVLRVAPVRNHLQPPTSGDQCIQLSCTKYILKFLHFDFLCFSIRGA
jgi:hypothetical protein